MINILISVDSNYLTKAQTMLFSLRLHTKEEIAVYLLNHRLTEAEIDGFRLFLKNKCKMELVHIDAKDTALDNFPVGDLNFTIEMYYRILAQFLLPTSVDRILWIDADIVVLKDVSEFYHQPFNGAKYVVCEDSQSETSFVQESISRLGLPAGEKYFNSGVMLMNLGLLRQETNLVDILKRSDEIKEKLTYPDQDILNYLYYNQVKYADWKTYNYQLAGVNCLSKSDVKDIVILHYTGMRKPWNYWQIVNVSKHYWKVRFKQGDRIQTIKAYAKRLWEATVMYFKEIKSIF